MILVEDDFEGSLHVTLSALATNGDFSMYHTNETVSQTILSEETCEKTKDGMRRIGRGDGGKESSSHVYFSDWRTKLNKTAQIDVWVKEGGEGWLRTTTEQTI